MRLDNLTDEELYELFELKYGNPEATGWSPKQRFDWGYYLPSDIYELVVKKSIKTTTRWIDVGGGSALFPENEKLSRLLADKCEKLVAVDPSDNVYDNPYAHEKVRGMFEDFETDEKYNLATFRMVAEHIDDPQAVLNKLESLLSPDGMVIVYTINKYSPIPLITKATPFSLHYKIKKFFWGGEERDTFPVTYKMNTRKELRNIFEANGFVEDEFYRLDDLSTFVRFKSLSKLELIIWKGLSKLGLSYPEYNLLGVYRRK